MNEPLPPLDPRPGQAEGLPPLAPRRAPSQGALPPLGPVDPAGEAPHVNAGAASPPPPVPPTGTRAIGRAAREPKPERRAGDGTGRRRSGMAALVAAALIAGAVAGGATTYLLDDPSSGTGSEPTTGSASAESQSRLPLQDAIAAVDSAVVQVQTPGGLGSGVVIKPRGLIITNNHVIEGASGDEVLVITADKRRVPATIAAKNPSRDLAVLKPKGSVGEGVDLASEPDGALRSGDQVFAIGSPFGLQGTVTVGVVSAVNRAGDSGMRMIQTDAPINPGNSGGGLFDLRGRLVGVPTSINSPVPGNVGIGFAVPANQVRIELENVK
ncbi:MAG: trypsin-like serine protease [Actinobacteria bacterium]|nr:trypsin-like serine protease [Actinomycetota bacterium]MBM3697109.1 trypsin-like serine protease [Actinomycetota bacterium]